MPIFFLFLRHLVCLSSFLSISTVFFPSALSSLSLSLLQSSVLFLIQFFLLFTIQFLFPLQSLFDLSLNLLSLCRPLHFSSNLLSLSFLIQFSLPSNPYLIFFSPFPVSLLSLITFRLLSQSLASVKLSEVANITIMISLLQLQIEE